MNKTQLIEAVAQQADLKKKDAEAAVNAVMAAIENAYTSRSNWNNSNSDSTGSVHSTMSSADLISELESLGE